MTALVRFPYYTKLSSAVNKFRCFNIKFLQHFLIPISSWHPINVIDSRSVTTLIKGWEKSECSINEGWVIMIVPF